MKSKKGITLIALVITIIVLLILAGVSINLVVGEGGILGKAQNAVTKTEEAKQKEQEDLDSMAGVIDNYLNNNPSEEPGNAGGENLPDVPESQSGETLLSQITSANYGDYVSGYNIDLGIATAGNAFSNGKIPVTDWRIFYKDSTNVYLIASDYLPTSKYPENVFGANNGQYNGYWSASGSNLTTSGTVTTNNNFLFTKLSNVTNTNLNYQAVATLVDSSKWSTLASTSWVDNTATAVIGTPTVEMWMASWNQKYSDTLAFDANATGYQVGLTADSLSNYITSSKMQGKAGFNDTLYYPHGNTSGNAWNSCYGYWLASPSAFNAGYVMLVYCKGDVFFNSFNYNYYGVRPVVSLSSGVKGTSTTTDGVTTWTLSN